MNQYINHAANSEASTKWAVVNQFPYLAPLSTFRSGSETDSEGQFLQENQRGTGTLASPVFVMNTSRWGSKYWVVTD